MKKIKISFRKHTLCAIISLMMVAVFTVNVFAVIITCHTYSHVDNVGLTDASHNPKSIELIMYMRPTLISTNLGKDGYRVSNMVCSFDLNPLNHYAPEYYKSMGALYTISVIYQLSNGSQLTKDFQAWSYLGDIADNDKDDSIYRSPTVSIDITNPGFDYQYIYYYDLLLELRHDCTEDDKDSGEVWDYGIMKLGLNEIISDNT